MFYFLGKQDFVINLTNGPKVEFDDEVNVLDDRLLCVRVDIDKKKVFMNACINGEWGREGTIKHKWQTGDEFDIRVRCHEDEFEVYVDHKLMARFAHYVPLNKITHIYINGDIELFSSSWEGMYYVSSYLYKQFLFLERSILRRHPGKFLSRSKAIHFGLGKKES